MGAMAVGGGRWFWLVVLAAVVVGLGGGAARGAGLVGDENWTSFGNTANANRYSPLTQITAANVSQLGRAFTVDLNKIVPGIKKGQQTYPIVVNGVMYVTSGDDQVFAVNAATGALIWHYAPDNIATFKNYGIVANRGVAYCDGRVFLLTLDMTIVALDPATGAAARAGARSRAPCRAHSRTTATRRPPRRSAPTTASSSARPARSTARAAS